MPLSEGAFPYVDPETQETRVWDTPPGETAGVSYAIDDQGNVLIPGEEPENPFWDQRPKFAPQQPAQPTAGPPAGRPQGQPTQQPAQLPPVNVQPGLSAQQWEATYALSLAAEKRLREVMETIDQPRARAAIDEAIQALAQARYNNQVAARESQSVMTGYVPRWMPQVPQFEPGAWRGYQTGGLVAPPGSAVPGAASPGMPGVSAPLTDDQAAQAIWNARPDIQQMYRAEHPDWQPVQAVMDWWGFAPHEGVRTLGDYARMKGYLAA